MRIVIAVDGSPIAVKAARQAAKLAGNFKQAPTLVLLTVDPPLSKSVAIALGPETVARYHADNAKFALRGAGAALRRAGLDYEEKPVMGDPAAVIARFCTAEKADLLIMGSRGRGMAKSLLLGSVTMKVLSSASTPTLIVR